MYEFREGENENETSETENPMGRIVIVNLSFLFLPYISTTCRQKAILGSMRKGNESYICAMGPTKKHKRSLIFACFMILILGLPSAKKRSNPHVAHRENRVVKYKMKLTLRSGPMKIT